MGARRVSSRVWVIRVSSIGQISSSNATTAQCTCMKEFSECLVPMEGTYENCSSLKETLNQTKFVAQKTYDDAACDSIDVASRSGPWIIAVVAVWFLICEAVSHEN